MTTRDSSLITWRDSFSTGVPEVDHEHRELIQLINESIERILEHGSHNTVMFFLGEIHARISAHFALEERVMQEQDYDEFPEHKAAHDILLDQILDIMDEYESRDSLDTARLAARLSDWFSGHFQTLDARLHRKLNVY